MNILPTEGYHYAALIMVGVTCNKFPFADSITLCEFHNVLLYILYLCIFLYFILLLHYISQRSLLYIYLTAEDLLNLKM